MRRIGRIIILLAAAALPASALAVDAPHATIESCSGCHMGHNAPGGSLTKRAGMLDLCNTCHQNFTTFGGAWALADQAAPGARGNSHSWSGLATNRGAKAPSASSSDPVEAQMGRYLVDGASLKCTTCHDVHQADAVAEAGRGTQHVSAVTAPMSNTGNGAITVNPPAAGAAAKGYRIEITATGTLTTARFRLSNDNGSTWWGCSAPGAYVAYVASPSNACTTAATVRLNDGTNVTVALAAGTYNAGDRWDFYVSYPFLRVAHTGDAKLCTTCHPDRNMSVANINGTGPHQGTGAPVVPWTTVNHHPVGASIIPARTLDANGGAAGSDGNASNDLVLGSHGGVTCLTCHRMHNADSNSMTVDAQ